LEEEEKGGGEKRRRGPQGISFSVRVRSQGGEYKKEIFRRRPFGNLKN